MTALAANRNTKRAGNGATIVKRNVSCGVDVLYSGGMVGRNASGYAVAASSALSQRTIGVAMETVDNSLGSAGDEVCDVEVGAFWMANSASTDALTIADIDEVCFVVDDATVARSAGTAGTRQPAGRVRDVSSTLGVLVEILGNEDLSGGSVPTITTGTNTTASSVPVMLFQRVGNVVQFTGRASVSHTAGVPTASTFEISVPIASAMDAAADVIGTVTGDLVTKGYLTAELTNNTIVANYSIGGTGAQVVHFSGSYLVK